MSSNSEDGHNGVNVEALELLLHALAHEVESQAYLQMAVRAASDPDLKALLVGILGQEQMHESQLRLKLRERYHLDV